MSDTLTTTTETADTATDARPRVPTRWSLSGTRSIGPSDGAWWPQSANLATELADLDVAVQAALHQRIARATYTEGMWPSGPRMIRTPLGMTEVDWFSRTRYPENIDLTLTGSTHLVLTVIPARTDADFAEIVLGDYGAAPVERDRSTRTGLDRWDNEGGHPATRTRGPARPLIEQTRKALK